MRIKTSYRLSRCATRSSIDSSSYPLLPPEFLGTILRISVQPVVRMKETFSLALIVNTTTTLTTSGRGSMHTIENYYRGAVAALGDGRLASSDRSRIIEYVYLGDDQAKMVFESTFTNALATPKRIAWR